MSKLTCKEVFQVLKGWSHLVQIEQHPNTYQGKITALEPDTGTVTFSARIGGEQRLLVFQWANADFERSSDPGESWEEAFVVFPQSEEMITLRKWKS